MTRTDRRKKRSCLIAPAPIAASDRLLAAMIRTSTCRLSRLADRAHLAVLENPEELGLGLERQLGDLVQEERAAVSGGEEAGVSGLRTRERAAAMPEELALHQIARQGRAVQRDERLPRAPAAGVDGPRHQLLARARLAGDEHGRLAARGGPRTLEDRPHAARPAHDAIEAVVVRDQAMEALHPVAQLGRLEDPLDLLQEQLLRVGDGHEVLGASPDDLRGEPDRRLAGEDEHREAGPAILHRGEQVEGPAVRADVADDEEPCPGRAFQQFVEPRRRRRA